MRNRFLAAALFAALGLALGGCHTPAPRTAAQAPAVMEAEAFIPAWLDHYAFIQERGTQRVYVDGFGTREHVFYWIPPARFVEFVNIYVDFLEDHTLTGPMRHWQYMVDADTFFWYVIPWLNQNVRAVMGWWSIVVVFMGTVLR